MFLGPPQAKIFEVPDRFLRNPPLFVPDLKQGGFLNLNTSDPTRTRERFKQEKPHSR